jgi:hypothetical protein
MNQSAIITPEVTVVARVNIHFAREIARTSSNPPLNEQAQRDILFYSRYIGPVILTRRFVQQITLPR